MIQGETATEDWFLRPLKGDQPGTAWRRNLVRTVFAGIAESGPTHSRFDQNSAATWTIPHTLGRVPQIQLFTSAGEQIHANITVDSSIIVVEFSQPQAGFVLAG